MYRYVLPIFKKKMKLHFFMNFSDQILSQGQRSTQQMLTE